MGYVISCVDLVGARGPGAATAATYNHAPSGGLRPSFHLFEQQTLQIGFIEQAHRIYLFDEVYPLSAAKEQAEKKKLAAFGMLAKFNPLNRPREDTVMLTRHELRLEPFWHIVAQRQVDYEARVT